MPTEKIFRTPGQLIQSLLDERGWTQAVLGTVLNLSPTIVNRMVNNQRHIDAKTALALGEAFGVSPKRFMILQGQYDLAKAKIEVVPDPKRSARAQLYNDLPVREMVRRGWLAVEDFREPEEVESALASFFGVADSGSLSQPSAHSQDSLHGDGKGDPPTP